MNQASQRNTLTRLKLPRQGSNLDSSDPESDVLPVTPRGTDRCGLPPAAGMELRGIEPLTSALRTQRSPS